MKLLSADKSRFGSSFPRRHCSLLRLISKDEIETQIAVRESEMILMTLQAEVEQKIYYKMSQQYTQPTLSSPLWNHGKPLCFVYQLSLICFIVSPYCFVFSANLQSLLSHNFSFLWIFCYFCPYFYSQLTNFTFLVYLAPSLGCFINGYNKQKHRR